MGFSGTTNATATTPGRKTHLFVDTQYPVTKEGPFAFKREGLEIARAGFGPNNSSNAFRYGNGGIGLIPIQAQPGQLAETAAGNSLVIPKSGFDFPSGMLVAERPGFRQQTELTGNTYDASVSSSGDNFLVKTVTAGQSWNQSHTADITAFGQILVSPEHVKIDRFGVGRQTFAADQGYSWRFQMTGRQTHARQVVGGFYFGGPAAEGGYGLFGLMLFGTGMAGLYEGSYSGGTPSWALRHEFRFAPADRVSGVSHQILIKPYLAENASSLGYIDFVVNHTDVSSSPGGMTQQFYQAPLANSVSCYVVYRRATPAAPLRPSVTGAGPVRLDLPRESRHPNQIARIGYPASGWVEDYAFALPFFVGTTTNLVVHWDGSVPTGTTLTVKLLNHTSGAELTLVSSTDNSRTYTRPAGVSHFRIKAEMTSDGTNTPILTTYHVKRQGIIVERAPTEVEVEAQGGKIISVSVSGPESDPSHETASVQVDDMRDLLTVLNQRGRVSYRLETEYNAANTALRSVLSEGFFIRSPGRRHTGKKNEGFGGGGAARAYPAQKRRDFLLTGMGNWLRLREKISFQKLDYTEDPDTNPRQPWKITAIVADLLAICGFPPDMIDVPDNAMRLFPTFGQTNKDLFVITPGQEIGEVILKLLRDYLGWFLVWDSNAGTRGKWRAIAPKLPPYTNLAVFRTARSANNKLANHAGAYGNAASGYWSATGSVTGFVKRSTLETWVKPPEANAVLCLGGGADLPGGTGNYVLANWLVNRDGLDYFSGYAVDPTNPDFIGELLPLLYVDFGLRTQAAVDYMTWRIFHVACHGIKMARFEGPLLLITDATDTSQTKPRPLRYYDPVQVNDDGVTSQWLVRNVNPGYRRDGHQWATYELESPRAPYA